MRPIIRVDGIGKRYRIGHRQPYRTIRESIVSAVSSPVRHIAAGFRDNRSGSTGHDEIWALRDVSFEVAPGEVLGLIGRNGAGKSTLLKILSRITEPTTGRAELYGRVGSLLEVGTGFHPELTGRENIYLSGAILGMRRAEITRKFEEIIAFAEIERFVDTPVKFYSSGMYVRLAFAVAAHLEPEILLVDEVLAVGDAAFQKKCLGKIGEVARGGRTIIFVSHNMAAIESLCTSGIVIRAGRASAKTSATDAVNDYMRNDIKAGSGARSLVDHPGRRNGSRPTMIAVELSSASDRGVGVVRMGAPLAIAVSYKADRPLRPVLGITARTSREAPLFCVSDRFSQHLAFCEPASAATVVCTIERLPLMPGSYIIDVWLNDGSEDIDVVMDAISFDVLAADLLGSGHLPPSVFGPFFCPGKFELIPERLLTDGTRD